MIIHVETISDFLFSKFCLFLSFKIQSFSSKHKLHLFDPPVYEIYCFNTDQVMSKSCLLSFSFQIYFESSVSFEYLLWLKDLMWFLYRSLNELHKCFEQFGLKITAEANLHVVNFLDVTFDLNNGKFKPYRKPNADPLYINRHSNHPSSIIKQLLTSINKRISAHSADEHTFHESAPIYQNALRHSNFDYKPDYMKQAPQKTRRNRQRNIIWFNPPFSKNVKTNIARNFLCPIDKYFQPNLTTSYTRFSTETQSRSVIAA